MANPADSLPSQTPSHVKHLMTTFVESLEADAPVSALKSLQLLFAYLLGHFTDLSAGLCIQLGASSELYSKSEEDSISLLESENRLLESINFLSENHSSVSEALGLISVFVDTNTGHPRSFFTLAGAGKMKDSMGGMKRYSDFCKPPQRGYNRSDASKLISQYGPHLEVWLTVAAVFWGECEMLDESTTLKGRQRIKYQFRTRQLEAGMRCEVGDCTQCIPARVLELRPPLWDKEDSLGFPGAVPEHLLHLVDRWSDRLNDVDIIGSTSLMRDTFEFLVRYFSGISYTLCLALDAVPAAARTHVANTQSVDNCERLLQVCVESLKSYQDDPAARAVVGVFFRRTATLELEPRAHTNLLLIEGVLSSWFKRERGQQPSEERSKNDLERYYPVFRDWVKALFQFFGLCEHFDDPPTKDGVLPLSVRLGDYLLELTEPTYTLRIRQCPICLPEPSWLKSGGTASVSPKEELKLARERDERLEAKLKEEEELRAAPKFFPGEFPPVAKAPDSPKFLLRQTTRLDIYVRRGQFPEARQALKDVLDYLVRYWAGVAVAACRASGTMSEERAALSKDSLSIQQCERLLNECLHDLVADQASLSQEILSVFYNVDIVTDELKSLGAHSRILMTDADSKNKMQLLADFCESSHEADTGRCRSDLKTFLPIVRDWLKLSQSFFEQCEHHEEDIDSQGRLELVVQFDQTFLELVAPDYAFYVKIGSDVVPDLPVPEYIEPVVETPVVVEQKKVVAQTAESLALAEPFLVHRVAFVGVRENSKKVMCKSGKIRIENAGGGSLTGRAVSTHPCIEVSPARFRDNTQLDYWLDEKSIPKDFIPTIVLRSGGDERTVTVSELRPVSALATISKTQAILFIYSFVGGAWLLYFAAYFYDTAQIAKYLSETGTSLSQLAADDQARNIVIGKAQLAGWMHICIPVISGSSVFAFFRRLSPVMQDIVVKHFERALLLPALIDVFVVLIFMGIFRTGYTNRPEIPPLYLGGLLPWFVVFTVGMYTYAQLSYKNVIASWIPVPAMRRIVGPICFLVFVMLSVLALI